MYIVEQLSDPVGLEIFKNRTGRPAYGAAARVFPANPSAYRAKVKLFGWEIRASRHCLAGFFK